MKFFFDLKLIFGRRELLDLFYFFYFKVINNEIIRRGKVVVFFVMVLEFRKLVSFDIEFVI